MTWIMSGSFHPPGPASGDHLSAMSARLMIGPQLDEMSQAMRHRFETLTDCSGSGETENGSMLSTIGLPVRLSACVHPRRPAHQRERAKGKEREKEREREGETEMARDGRQQDRYIAGVRAVDVEVERM